MDSVLVATPTHECKEYCFQEWIDAVNALSYENHSILVVDNTNDPGFYRRWNRKVNMVHLPSDDRANRRIALSMEYVRRSFLSHKFDWYLNVESDVIVPPNTIEIMLEYAKDSEWARTLPEETSFICHPGNVDWLAAPYESRYTGDWIRSAFGCTLFSRELMEAVDFTGAPYAISTDGWLRFTVVRPMNRFNLCDIPVGAIKLEHLHNKNEVPIR